MRLNSIKLVRLQVLRRTHQLPAARPAGRRGRPQRLRQVQHHGRGALGARREQGQRAARRVDAGRDLQRHRATRKPASRASVELVFDNADDRAGGQWNQFAEIAVKRVLTRDGTSSYYINNQPVRRRDVQDVFLGTGLGPARLRHHRPGHDQPHHRVQARRAAPVPRRGRRRLQVQGAPPRDREPPEGHAREPDPRRRHPARAQRQPRQAREAGRGRAALQRAAGSDAHAQAAPAVVPEAHRERRASRSASRPRPPRRVNDARSAHGRPAPHRGRARNDPPGALRRRRPAARRRRASSTRPAPKSAGSRSASASWSKAASASSSAWPS